LEGSLI